MNRFDRITAILIQLQSRRVVSARDMAQRFEVSLRTIYRDIRTLELAGVPIIGEAGIGYSIMDGYRLPPVMFTKDEASSFVAAEKLMEKFTDATLKSHFKSAMYKVKAILKTDERDLLSDLENHVEINPAHSSVNSEIPNALNILLRSISDKKQVRLQYRAIQHDDITEREIEPVGVFHENNYWYVLGYCHLRKDYRQFRTDRLRNIRLTDSPFTKTHGNLDEYRKKEEQPTSETEIILLVDKKVCPYIRARGKHYGLVDEQDEGDKIKMIFRTSYGLEGISRWYLMFADYAKILSPEGLKRSVHHLLNTIKINQE